MGSEIDALLRLSNDGQNRCTSASRSLCEEIEASRGSIDSLHERRIRNGQNIAIAHHITSRSDVIRRCLFSTSRIDEISASNDGSRDDLRNDE